MPPPASHLREVENASSAGRHAPMHTPGLKRSSQLLNAPGSAAQRRGLWASRGAELLGLAWKWPFPACGPPQPAGPEAHSWAPATPTRV